MSIKAIQERHDRVKRTITSNNSALSISAHKDRGDLLKIVERVAELVDAWEEDESTNSAPYQHYRNGNQCANEIRQILEKSE